MPLLKILYCLFCQLIFICSDFNRSLLHLDLACVQTELSERSECRKQLIRTHTHAQWKLSLFPQLWGSLRWCFYSYTIFLSDHMSQPVFVFRVWFGLCLWGQVGTLTVSVICHFNRHSLHEQLHAFTVHCLCVCVKGCDKTACMLGIKVVSVLQCWLADLLLRKKWHRSKQELEPSRSVCVSVCFLCFLLIPLLALSFLSPGGLLSTLRYLHVFLHDCSVDYSDVAGLAVRSLCGLLPLNSSYLKYGVCIGRFGFTKKKGGVRKWFCGKKFTNLWRLNEVRPFFL